MKIALLFSGQPRYLSNPFPLLSHQREVLNKYDTDVYVHTWYDDNVKEYDFSSWSRISSCSIESNAPEKIKQMYNPVEIVVEKSKKFKFSPFTKQLLDGFTFRNGFTKEQGWTDKNYNNILSSLYSIERVCNLVEPKKNEYDFIIWSRLDNIIYKLPDLNQCSTSKFYLSDHHPKFPDLLFFFGHKFLDALKIYSSVDYLIQNNINNLWGPSMNEPLKMFNYIRNFDIKDICPIRLPVRVVRDNENRGDTDKLYEYGLSNEDMFL